jgi:hypothetical protein
MKEETIKTIINFLEDELKEEDKISKLEIRRKKEADENDKFEIIIEGFRLTDNQ